MATKVAVKSENKLYFIKRCQTRVKKETQENLSKLENFAPSVVLFKSCNK